MQYLSVFFALVVVAAGCVGQTGGPFVSTPAAGQRPAWQQMMENARDAASAGENYVLLVGRTGVYVFYNNPRPFCYTYMIPGDWVKAPQPNAYRSKDGRAYVRVEFVLARDLEGSAGSNLVERIATAMTRNVEKDLRVTLRGVELVPFQSARPGVWKWKAAPFKKGEHYIHLQAIIVDLSPDAVVEIDVLETGDDDALARRIIETLRTTSNPECYWPVLETMLKAGLGVR